MGMTILVFVAVLILVLMAVFIFVIVAVLIFCIGIQSKKIIDHATK